MEPDDYIEMCDRTLIRLRKGKIPHTMSKQRSIMIVLLIRTYFIVKKRRAEREAKYASKE